MHISHRPHLGIAMLLCSVLCTQQSGEGLSSPASARQADTSERLSIPMLDEGKGLIHLDVSVTDAQGEPVPGLHRKDFEVLDQDHPQEILSFHALDERSDRPQAPAQLVFFMDTVGLLGDKALRAEVSIEQFLRQRGGNLSEPTSIFGLSDDGFWTIAHHDSIDGNSLASDMSAGKRVILNHHPDALRALAFIGARQRRKRGHKIMLWIGPGCGKGTGIFPASHNEGHKTFNSIYWFRTLLREARLSIDELAVDQEGPCAPGYQLYLTGPRTVREADDRFLYKKVLAIHSGGSVFDDSGDLVAEINRSVGRARAFYTLSFDPPITLQDHEYHSLAVRVAKPGLLARTNTSYYDEPYYSDLPNPALQRITVDQLGIILSEIGSRDAGDWEKKLAHVELTERLSLRNLANWTEGFHAAAVQRALVGLADASSFFAPPAAEILKQAVPSSEVQERMISLIRKYLEETIPKLPNFYATRTTVTYEDIPPGIEGWAHGVDYQPLHVVQTEKANVYFRAGDEVVEKKGGQPQAQGDQILITSGTFGPILAGLRYPVETGRMKWVRWERSQEGSRAVFEFEIPPAESKDLEGGCCLPEAEGQDSFRIHAGYHGEITINPATGMIVRLQLQYDLHEYVPEDVGEVQIDYGPVKIGGKTYFCPVRSVSFWRARSIVSLKLWDESFLNYGPYTTRMNDMRFSNYHVFRSELRILPGFTPNE